MVCHWSIDQALFVQAFGHEEHWQDASGTQRR